MLQRRLAWTECVSDAALVIQMRLEQLGRTLSRRRDLMVRRMTLDLVRLTRRDRGPTRAYVSVVAGVGA